MNSLYQNGSLTKHNMVIFDMYLPPCVWYSGATIIGSNDTKKKVYLIWSKKHL